MSHLVNVNYPLAVCVKLSKLSFELTIVMALFPKPIKGLISYSAYADECQFLA